MFGKTLLQYFPSLSEKQLGQFEALEGLYAEWNEKINVISRKDIENINERHILHSLAIASFLGELKDDTSIVDVGTGGGFPAIPLAIFYPNVKFHLVDRIAKKLKVAEEIGKAVGLENITIQHGDFSECHSMFDYAVSRAVMQLKPLIKTVCRNINPHNANNHPNGLICLKGGDLAEEIRGINRPVVEIPVSEYFKGEFFDTKKIIYVPISV